MIAMVVCNSLRCVSAKGLILISVPVSAGGFGGDPSSFTKDERGGAVLSGASRALLVADVSISVEDDIYFGGRLEDRAMLIELFSSPSA